mmetsp:Transcript_79584/g.225063  ORF Transcript_79584/g.225063 Transcript_79584/m.225063 type:complete len:304 (+) Transcript_79584:83-994(+)
MADEEVLKKKGVELFKELLRVYPVADVEDYYKAGVWREELMKTDLQLIEAHRKEAGAPDPIPLEEVPEPTLPAVAAGGIVLPGLGGVRPLTPGFAAGAAGAGLVRPLMPAAGAAAATATAGSQVAEIRLIALFVAKWKLDPTRTKAMLLKLTPARRRHVIQTFKTTDGATDPTSALEQYIAQCEKTNAWGAATAAPGATMPTVATIPAIRAVSPRPVFPGATVASVGVKRPMAQVAFPMDQSKRPRLGLAAAAPAARIGAARPVMPVQQMRPQFPRPVAPANVPKAKAGEKPGELIRNLLQRF